MFSGWASLFLKENSKSLSKITSSYCLLLEFYFIKEGKLVTFKWKGWFKPKIKGNWGGDLNTRIRVRSKFFAQINHETTHHNLFGKSYLPKLSTTSSIFIESVHNFVGYDIIYCRVASSNVSYSFKINFLLKGHST